MDLLCCDRGETSSSEAVESDDVVVVVAGTDLFDVLFFLDNLDFEVDLFPSSLDKFLLEPIRRLLLL